MLIIVCRTKSERQLDFCTLKIAMKSNSKVLERFGKRVRELRKEKGLSQEQLADRANLHRTYIGMIERAEKNITLINIKKIAIALDVSISELIKE